MRGRHLLGLAAVAFVIAFFLPSGHYQKDIPGWRAAWDSLEPLFRLDGISGAASALTNLLFVAAWLITLLWPRRLTRALEWAVWAAALYNTVWFVSPDARQYLRAGYYLWVASFVLLGYALHQTRRERLAASGGQPSVAAR